MQIGVHGMVTIVPENVKCLIQVTYAILHATHKANVSTMVNLIK